MGEYVWATIEIKGLIATIDAFEDLVAAIEGKGLGRDYDQSPLDREEIIEAFVGALANGSGLTFTGETNYGNMDEVCAACQEHGIAYEHTFDSAGGEAAGSRVWHPGDEHEIDSEKGVVGPDELAKLLDEPDLAAAIRATIARLERAYITSLPELSVSDEVRDFLAVEIARAKVTS